MPNEFFVSDPQEQNDRVRLNWGPSIWLGGLFILGMLYTLYFGRVVLIPIVLSLILSTLLTPCVDVLTRFRLPRALGAGLLIATIVFLLGFGVSFLSPAASEALVDLPEGLRKLENRVKGFYDSFREVTQATEKVADAMAGGDENAVKVEIEKSPLISFMLNRTREFLASTALVIVLVFFLLSSRDTFLRKLVLILPEYKSKRVTVEIVRHIELDISRYIGSITVINAVLGLAIGTAMWLLGMPNPILIGVLAAVLNFIPYLGSMAGALAVCIFGFLEQESLTYGLTVAASYSALSTLEGYFVTPAILGNRLQLNPVVILIGLVFWGWIWGIMGLLLTVPIIASLKIVCDQVEPLKTIGVFLEK